jgi:broad specificity phosphatase PhoE
VIYFTRHGESVANVADRARRPVPQDGDRLSELGWEQAQTVGRRLEGEGIELVLASHYRRAQETAQAISEHLGGLPVETMEDLHEVRQSDAYYAAAPDYGETGTISWMPRSERDFAEPGAESFEELVGRVRRVQDRLIELAPERRVLCVSHWGFLHFFLGVTLFGDAFAPEHLDAIYRVAHANTGITIFDHQEDWGIDGRFFGGWALTTWNDQGHL